jgi:hypothetical protein
MLDSIRTRTESKPPRTAAVRLAERARAAADVRAHDTNPDVVAYRIERLRAWVDRLVWTGLILGLLFTMANVQHFAADGAEPWSIPWVIAWLLDPMVSLVLVGVLLGEQVIARHGIVAGAWVRRTKWTALSLTYAMNTWSSWAAADPAQILLHSVPPVMVFCAAEAVTTLRLQITEAVRKAYETAVRTAPAPVPAPRTIPVPQPVPAVEPRTEAAPAPAERAAFARTLRAEILAAADRGDRWGPDYAELIARSRRSRSWVEKRVREARTAVFRPDEAAA